MKRLAGFQIHEGELKGNLSDGMEALAGSVVNIDKGCQGCEDSLHVAISVWEQRSDRALLLAVQRTWADSNARPPLGHRQQCAAAHSIAPSGGALAFTRA